MKNYPPQFKADAVAPYQSRPEATIRQVAADPGINPETLRNRVRAAGASRPRGRRAETPAGPPTRLGAENAALRKKVRGLEEEREILRKAAPSSGLVRHGRHRPRRRDAGAVHDPHEHTAPHTKPPQPRRGRTTFCARAEEARPLARPRSASDYDQWVEAARRRLRPEN
ncbi:transposase [Streptomyces viridosporus]